MIPAIRHVAHRVQVGFLAALLFWIPDVILHLFREHNFTGRDVRFLTWVLPLVTLTGLWLLPKVSTRFTMDAWAPLVAAMGIWFFGPFFMMVGWTNAGGGFAKSLGWGAVLLETALFPVFTFIMSVYDGTLAALAVVTGALLLHALLIWSRRWGLSANA